MNNNEKLEEAQRILEQRCKECQIRDNKHWVRCSQHPINVAIARLSELKTKVLSRKWNSKTLD